MKAQEPLVKDSSSMGLHATLKARLVSLHDLLMQYEQLEDLLAPARKEVMDEVKKEYNIASYFISKPSGQR